MTWRPKPRNWRKRWGYKPPSFRVVVKRTDKEWNAAESRYRLWLSGTGREDYVTGADAPMPAGTREAVEVAAPRLVERVAKVARAPAVDWSHVPVAAPALVREAEPIAAPAVIERPESVRRRDAAALLRELAGNYGPRRAHKLRAMADFVEAGIGKPLRVVVDNGD